MVFNIVLDIDGVLACNEVKKVEVASFFNNRGAIINAVKTHYIFPGVIEFIKLLFQTEGIRVSFFSAGTETRNKIFVKELLKMSLGQLKYKEIKQKVTVLSHNNLIKCGYEWRDHYDSYGLRAGNKQKDLSKILQNGELLENTVLIDDDSSYVACGQAKNLLSLHYTQGRNYKILPSKLKKYQSTGFKYLQCILANELNPFQQKTFESGKNIFIVKSNDQFFLNFLDKDYVCQIHHICKLENRFLFNRLKKVHFKNINQENTSYSIKNSKLKNSIYELVDLLGGRFQKICRSPNRIFYAAGLLFSALEKSKNENLPISECLFRLQFKLKKNTETYEPDFTKLYKQDSLYLLGLEKLKEVNSELQLTNPFNYIDIIKTPISDESRALLEKLIENEGDGCCIT